MSIDPDTSHSAASLVLLGVRLRNARATASPPVARDRLTVRRTSSRAPRAREDCQRRPGRRARRRAMRLAILVISPSSSPLKPVKFRARTESRSLSPGTRTGSPTASPACAHCCTDAAACDSAGVLGRGGTRRSSKGPAVFRSPRTFGPTSHHAEKSSSKMG